MEDHKCPFIECHLSRIKFLHRTELPAGFTLASDISFFPPESVAGSAKLIVARTMELTSAAVAPSVSAVRAERGISI